MTVAEINQFDNNYINKQTNNLKNVNSSKGLFYHSHRRLDFRLCKHELKTEDLILLNLYHSLGYWQQTTKWRHFAYCHKIIEMKCQTHCFGKIRKAVC